MSILDINSLKAIVERRLQAIYIDPSKPDTQISFAYQVITATSTGTMTTTIPFNILTLRDLLTNIFLDILNSGYLGTNATVSQTIYNAVTKTMTGLNTPVLASTGMLNLLGGTNPIARQNDGTISNNSLDSTYWTWLSGLINVFTSWTPVPGDGGTALHTAISSYIPGHPVPTSLTGKINNGSSRIQIP